MKKFFVIGNPIDHSLSPLLHNHWFKRNGIKATYEKKLIKKENEIIALIKEIREKKTTGVNVTVPLKNIIVPFLDYLTPEAEITQSVNTVVLEDKKVVGYNTDVAGFELAIRYSKYDVNGKKILIIGSGGVVPSIIFSLQKMKSRKIFIMNRTKTKAEKIKELFNEVEIVEWGKELDVDMIINATSIGLKKEDKINIDFELYGKNKFFYDVIYKPDETSFLKEARNLGSKTENGKMMFIYQAHQAFFIWNKILPEINQDIIELVSG
tara:strand:+ start:2549 stop:3346 length:798 start_codon:yes stop_codon:yes gene_type:complete